VVLKKLYKKHSESWILAGIARNLNTPKEILIELSVHDLPHLRRCAAQNPSTPAHILIALTVAYPTRYILNCDIAENPNCTSNTITNITGTVGVSTFTSLSPHGIGISDTIRVNSTANGLTAGTNYFVVTTHKELINALQFLSNNL
jgi:hypothetical protein